MPEIKYNLDVIDKAIADLSVLAASSNPGFFISRGVIPVYPFNSPRSLVGEKLSDIDYALLRTRKGFSTLVAATRDALAKARAEISTTDSNLGSSY